MIKEIGMLCWSYHKHLQNSAKAKSGGTYSLLMHTDWTFVWRGFDYQQTKKKQKVVQDPFTVIVHANVTHIMCSPHKPLLFKKVSGLVFCEDSYPCGAHTNGSHLHVQPQQRGVGLTSYYF